MWHWVTEGVARVIELGFIMAVKENSEGTYGCS